MPGPPIAFSTLGCPGLPIARVIGLARDTGWGGVEIRAHPEEPVSVGLSAGARAGYRALFDAAGVAVLSIASYVRVAAPDVDDTDCVDEVLRHVALARDLGAAHVRVFPGGGRQGRGADERAVRRLDAIADGLAGDVQVVLETHDTHGAGGDVARLLERVQRPGLGAVWDVLHTHLAGESPAETLQALGGWLRYVQLKDVVGHGDLTPCGLGDGTLPLHEVLRALRSGNYPGWLSLEWERRWFPGVPALAAVLPGAREFICGTADPPAPD